MPRPGTQRWGEAWGSLQSWGREKEGRAAAGSALRGECQAVSPAQALSLRQPGGRGS